MPTDRNPDATTGASAARRTTPGSSVPRRLPGELAEARQDQPAEQGRAVPAREPPAPSRYVAASSRMRAAVSTGSPDTRVAVATAASTAANRSSSTSRSASVAVPSRTAAMWPSSNSAGAARGSLQQELAERFVERRHPTAAEPFGEPAPLPGDAVRQLAELPEHVTLVRIEGHPQPALADVAARAQVGKARARVAEGHEHEGSSGRPRPSASDRRTRRLAPLGDLRAYAVDSRIVPAVEPKRSWNTTSERVGPWPFE